MAGSSYGTLFKLSTFGESHGDAIGGVIDGVPANVALDLVAIQQELNRRKPGQSELTTPRVESDQVQFLSGIFEGKTTGTPIGFIIPNSNAKSEDYLHLKDAFRPSHADFTYQQKYGIRDYRGGGRSSARETAIRVAAGGIAKKYLKEKYGIEIRGYVSQLGPITFDNFDWKEVHNNPFFCPDASKVSELEDYMDNLRKSGDSIGARINIVVSNMITGLGEPIFDRLDADIAHAMMSINAVKGIEIGAGFDAVNQKGSAHRDPITPEGFTSNNSGGILGGISSGQDLLISIALKPTSSIRLTADSIDKDGKATEISTTGRHDPCVGIRATPIAEAMLAITLMDHALRHRAQNADVTSSTPTVPAVKP